MSGRMRKRKPKDPHLRGAGMNLAKSFHAPQKDNSKRAKKRAHLNNYNEQKTKED
jgi:hypothetical protein